MKAVIFDFDGTLTKKDFSVWKGIWRELGYSMGADSWYARAFQSFARGLITHSEWCKNTCKAFMWRGMNKALLKDISSKIELCDWAEETIKTLKAHDCSLHIVSGNVKQVIYDVLGDAVQYFDSIHANDFVFDEKGNLQHIIGTNYDFKGKEKFVREFSEANGISVKDIYFIGNGWNDEWVHRSGCYTICINPTPKTDYMNREKWDMVLHDGSKLPQIILGENYLKKDERCF